MTFEKKNAWVANFGREKGFANFRFLLDNFLLDKVMKGLSVPTAWKPYDAQSIEISEASSFGAREAGETPESNIADSPSPRHQDQAAFSENIFTAHSTFYSSGELLSPASATSPEKFPGIKNYRSVKELLDRLKPRIKELSQAAREEEPEGQLPLSERSLQGLFGFLNKMIDRDLYLVPSLVLTYEGEIRAEWRSSPDHRLALEFINSSDLEFVFFYPKPSFPEKTLRISGSGSVTDFLDDQPKALELLRSLNRTGWKSIFFDMHHPRQEKTPRTLRATSPAGGFLDDHSGAGEASRKLFT